MTEAIHPVAEAPAAPAAPVAQHGAPRIPAPAAALGESWRVPGGLAGATVLDASKSVEELTPVVAALLRGEPGWFDYGGTVVRLGRKTTDSPWRPVQIDGADAYRFAKRHIEFATFDASTGRARKAFDGPRDVAARALRSGEWPGMPRLIGVADAPFIRGDGSIANREGHDMATGVHLTKSLPIPPKAKPGHAEAVEAARALLAAFERLPFDGERSRAACLAAALLPLARHAIDGPVPVHVFDASYFAAGGCLVPARAVAWLGLGYDAPADLVPPNVKAIDELVGPLAKEACRAIILGGEHVGPMGGAMAEALQADAWTGSWGRAQVSLPLRAVGFIAGIDLDVSPDLARRSLRIDLRAPASRKPLLARTGYEDMLSGVGRNRVALVGHALTILKAFHAAGRPSHGGSEHPLFPQWDRLVRSATVWATGMDPVDPSTFAEAPKGRRRS